jgi:D-3-phosphoglycerate dehydrogenase
MSELSPFWLPKERIKILLLEGISETAEDQLKAAGYSNTRRLMTALDEPALIDALQETHILGLRSRTQLTAKAVASAKHLITAGCFSVGTNQVDLGAARARGIPIFNAPFSNTRSVAELTMAEIVMLMRRIFPKSLSAHQTGWDKSAAQCLEARGKTLGIIGYGNIGSQLAVMAEALGMRVIYFDRTDRLSHGNAKPTETLLELLRNSDVVTLHVPEAPDTRNMIGAAEIRAMKAGAYLINNSRGTVVDLDALALALREKRLAGAAVDVFPQEPSSNSEKFVTPLQGLDNVILSPHVGGSTLEAQERIGAEVARKLVDYLDYGSTVGSVNFPQVLMPRRPSGTRFIHIHQNEPGSLRRLNEVFSNRDLNVAAQYCETEREIGYAVIDFESGLNDAEGLLNELQALPATINARICLSKNASRTFLISSRAGPIWLTRAPGQKG